MGVYMNNFLKVNLMVFISIFLLGNLYALTIHPNVNNTIDMKLKVIDKNWVLNRSSLSRANENQSFYDFLDSNNLMPDEEPERIAYITESIEEDLSYYDGSSDDSAMLEDINNRVIYSFEVYRIPNSKIPDYQRIDLIANEWWKKNQIINYMPLKIYLIDYRMVYQDTTIDDNNKTFFSVIPHRKHMSSQLVVFGLKEDCYLTNTSKKISYAILNNNGNLDTINIADQVALGFSNAGIYSIKVKVFFTDQTFYKSAFQISIQNYSDGRWFNSRIIGNNELDFKDDDKYLRFK